MSDVVIREAGRDDAKAWAQLRGALWPDEEAAHRTAIADALDRPDPERLTLLGVADDGAVGLAEAAIRHDHVNGCAGPRVLFLEGIYVAERWRRRGIARRLVDRVAVWGQTLGCDEFASDAPVDNEVSHQLHRSLGFDETERVVFFRRRTE